MQIEKNSIDHPFFYFLREKMIDDLPGLDAQLKMAPKPLEPNMVLPQSKTDTAVPSGVLVPVYLNRAGELEIVLTLRTNLVRHAGQISFPGGRRENTESLKETALRESHEEISLITSSVAISCTLTSLYVHNSDSYITPFVGFIDEQPNLKPNPIEVKEIIRVPLDLLSSNARLKQETWTLRNKEYVVPFWDIHPVPLWGATAMMLSEFIELYRIFKQT